MVVGDTAKHDMGHSCVSSNEVEKDAPLGDVLGRLDKTMAYAVLSQHRHPGCLEEPPASSPTTVQLAGDSCPGTDSSVLSVLFIVLHLLRYRLTVLLLVRRCLLVNRIVLYDTKIPS